MQAPLRPAWLTILLAAAPLPGCADGALDDDFDYYKNRFGLALTEPSPHRGAILGRAVLADGTAAAWAKVYAREVDAAGALGIDDPKAGDNPLTLTTNDKGGFYLGDLEPGAYRLFVVAPGGQGVGLALEVAAGVVQELEAIELERLRRVSGHAKLAVDPVHTGVVVYVPGTPFSAFTDNDGFYYLDLPGGTYDFRAERDTYAPYASGPMDIQADTTLDFTLSPSPWPGGRVTVVAPDPFIVRGLKTELKIEVAQGVRYMRVRRTVSQGPIDATLASLAQWGSVTSELTVTVPQDGLTSMTFEFMDAYGKTSEPVVAEFYNTSLDPSWTILYGTIKTPIVIQRGQKVAFIDASASIGGTFALSRVERESTAPPAPDASDEEYVIGTEFFSAVKIDAGAWVKGGARFLGTLTVNGTPAQPVVWQPLNEGGSIALSPMAGARLVHVQMQNVTLGIGGPADSGDVTFDGAHLSGFWLRSHTWSDGEPRGVNSRLRLISSRLDFGTIEMRCTDFATGGTEPAPAALDQVRVSIADSELTRTALVLECANAPGIREVALELSRNDFLETLAQTYFTVPAAGLPDQTAVAYSVADNHFRFPDRLHAQVSNGWPAWFGPNRAAPWGHFPR